MIDIIFPVHNRFEYTAITLPQVILEAETIPGSRLFVIDDGSEEDTRTMVIDMIGYAKCDITYQYVHYGNSYDSINFVLRNGSNPLIAKWDNDILFQVGATAQLAKVIDTNHLIGFLSPSVLPTGSHQYPSNIASDNIIKANHIGGIGLFRRKVFDKMIEGSTIKGEERFYGFTAYQYRSSWKKGIAGGVTVMELDKHPVFSRLSQYTASDEGRNIIGNVDSITNRMFAD